MKNVGNIDRLIRVIAGIVLISLVFIGPKTLWGWIGVIPLVTAFVGFCPAYRLFGLKTTKTTQEPGAKAAG
ncbi:MAG: DUF2892 domain-containing protein [Gammaproteobacteria bacterium]|nr:DUF2892 domain-containing protein [Gammaproteobacteria bacterium]